MELYDNPFSPFSFKVRAVLYEKGIECEKREIRRHADRAMLLRLNPRGEVPALADGDAVLSDSKVICSYLEERFPEPPLVPRDALGRARARYLELKSDTELDACVFVLGILKLMRSDLTQEVPAALPITEAALARHHAYLERTLDGKDWFLGAFSIVDIAVAPHLRSAAFLGYPPGSEHPALAAWLERTRQRSSLRQATREMAEAFAATRSDPDSVFGPNRMHWRNDRIEFALRCGLGPWLLGELQAERAFLSPIP